MRGLFARRIGAGTYLIAMSLPVIAWSLATLYVVENLAKPGRIDVAELNAWVSGFGVLLGLVFWPLSAGRLRDLNCPGWTVKILAFPLLGVIALPVLCFLSGHRWTNEFGDAPEPSGFLKIAVAVFLFVTATLFCYGALKDFYFARWMLSRL